MTEVQRLAAAYRRPLARVVQRVLLLSTCAVFIASAHLARVGTVTARTAAAAVIGLTVLLLFARYVRERHDFASVRRTLARVLVPLDRELGHRTLRAFKLIEQSERDATSGSPDLARLHFERLLRAASEEAVSKRAERRAQRWRWLSLALLVGCATALFISEMRVLEGFNVLLASKGRAPVAMHWLDAPQFAAQPPAYLQSSERLLFPGMDNEQPSGSVLTVRGVLARPGRRLVLTDGKSEVPFVSDGAGGVVARWALARSAGLLIAARFGDVLIQEPDTVQVAARQDEVPRVILESAPKVVQLLDIDRLELIYRAEDDHGIKQVDLVLYSGDRRDRRLLSRLNGETTIERGGYTLRSRDPFLRRMFLPVVVTIEARDNDPTAGPKWGTSEAITIMPPAVGQPESERMVALVAMRDAIIDLLAWLEEDAQSDAKPGPERNKARRDRARQVAERLEETADRKFAGLTLPSGLKNFLVGQGRILERGAASPKRMITDVEDALLAVDVALRALGTRDAQTVAKRLGDVAEEAADAAQRARNSENQRSALARLDAALGALVVGGDKLEKIGTLGRDLGSMTKSELSRIRRVRDRMELLEAELAARHLAARLRRPNPSFATAGRAGVESGGSGDGSTSGEPSNAHRQFDQLSQEIEQLAQEHAAEMARVARALDQAREDVDLERLRADAKQRAEALREAASDLPQVGAQPGSPRAAAALAREHARAMAQNLEQLTLEEAVQGGRDARAALEDANRKARAEGDASNWSDHEAGERAKSEIDKQLAWAEQALEQVRRTQEEAAREALMHSSDSEQELSRRAGQLASRGQHGESPLPEENVDRLERAESVMREAAEALRAADGRRGLELQLEAQRLLEQSSTGKTSDPDDAESDKDHGAPATKGDVPPENKNKDAADFRRRVLEGLAKGHSGRLAPAIRRYVEGLLR